MPGRSAAIGAFGPALAWPWPVQLGHGVPGGRGRDPRPATRDPRTATRDPRPSDRRCNGLHGSRDAVPWPPAVVAASRRVHNRAMPTSRYRGASLLRALGFVLQFATVGLALAFVVTRLAPGRFGGAPAPATATPPAGPASYREAVARAAPSVVNIYTRIMVAEPAYQIFADPTFQRFSGITLVPQRVPRRGLGSGVIVRADGYVLTNHHVIAGAQDILVGLSDGRITPASVVGTDRDTDLAVLKIEGSNLPVAAPVPAEQALAVGDVVLAIGNPLGIGQTVTIGIVSATGRNQLSLSRYEDFIQTDAAVNVGNSGGALVNARGDLVGINTSVFGRERGVQGISFAIPASAAGRVLEQIIDHGHVIRGWMGADYADVAQSASPVSDGVPFPTGPRWPVACQSSTMTMAPYFSAKSQIFSSWAR